MPQASQRLFLLDGMALMYRAHFALIQAPIRNSKGVNTSALYGFINTLLAILEKEQPSHIGVAFDTSAPTARHLRFPAYKAQRDAMPEELAVAIPRVKDLCRAFAIPVLELDGYEADDIIGTLVKRAEPAGFDCYMVTSDKDFAQLISPRIQMWRPGRKGSEHEIIGCDDLEKIWGVSEPDQIVDLLGLMGDASDNIPGVPGIGPKTAQKLIAEFGTVENLLANTAELKGKQRENLETFAEQARLSKALATILTDVPLDISWDELALTQRNDLVLKQLFAEFEFRTLTRRLFGTELETSASPADAAGSWDPPDSAGAVAPTLFESFQTIREVEHHYRLADSPELVTQLFAELTSQKSFCFDVETTSLDRFAAELLGIAFSWQAHEAWFLPYEQALLPKIKALFANSAEKIGHNLKFDLSILHRLGVEVTGPFFDTMLVHALVSPDQKHSMDYLAESLLGYTPVKLTEIAEPLEVDFDGVQDDLFAHAKKTKARKSLDMASIPLATLAEYAAEDADVTWRLAEVLRPQLAATGQTAVMCDIEGPLLPVLVRMEMCGITVDPQALSAIGEDLQTQIDQLAQSIEAHAGTTFNLASPKQLGEVLFAQLKLDERPKKTKTGQFRTDEQTLTALEGRHPIIAEILAWREASKLKSTYLDALPNHIVAQTGRVHTTFHQLIAGTGRLASSDPNLQNIPIRSEAGRKIRQAFVPAGSPPGDFEILSCDYSQIELRVMAAIANDPTMIEAFRQGIDIHATTAAKVYHVELDEVTSAQRRTAKMVNFGIIYGISAFGLSQRLGIPRAEASEIIDAYFREYPAVKRYMDRTIEEARSKGYAETLSGRRRSYPDLNSSNQNLRANAERAAVNMPIQGTAADMIKLAMIRIDELLRAPGVRSCMLLQVHDELVFDLAIDEKERLQPKILELMKTALPLPNDVPIEVECGTGPNWLAAH